ncbi:MAG: hypothetical protein ABI685_14150 [Ferruginibacter sp.]
MKKIINRLSILTIILAFSTGISAQTNFNVPPNYEFNVKEDYARYETDIITASKWLEEIDLDKEEAKRKEVSSFVMKWILGSPTVSVGLSEKIMKLYEKNDKILINYMAAYSAYWLQNKTTATKSAGVKAGLVSMMNVYKKGIKIKKNKEMDKLIKLTEEAKLDEYVSENLQAF